MKITRISTYQVDLPRDRAYKLSSGELSSVFDTTVVMVETDAGIIGLGEVCPFGKVYLPAYSAGARNGLAQLAPRLVGLDPRKLDVINTKMDDELKGHPYIKSALDIACWDILGRATGLPVCTLLGGRFGKDISLYQSIPHDTPQAMASAVIQARSQGFKRFQPKVGGEADIDIDRIHAVVAELKDTEVAVFDANGSWLPHEARRVVDACKGLNIYIEQPCKTYDECLGIRRQTDIPFVLDEVIDSVPTLIRAYRDGAMDAVNLKVSKVGGMSQARRFRDLCDNLGIAVTLEDSGGGSIIAAAISHLAQSTPERIRLGSASGYFLMKLKLADGAPTIREGRVCASNQPGLGLIPRVENWGEALVDTAL